LERGARKKSGVNRGQKPSEDDVIGRRLEKGDERSKKLDRDFSPEGRVEWLAVDGLEQERQPGGASLN